MPHLIYKNPTKVTLVGLIAVAIYFALSVLLFRDSHWYVLVLVAASWAWCCCSRKASSRPFLRRESGKVVRLTCG